MFKVDFTSNPTLSLGVEVEVQLVNPSTGDLTPVGPQILESLALTRDATPHIKSELFQSMIELDTPICQNAKEAGASLRKSMAILREIAKKFDADVMMSGTHPFAHYSEGQLTPAGRYFKLVDRNQWIARRLQIFGLHVHIGMKNGDHAIAMNNALCHYLPIILALSASSPFWQGKDTGLASSRITFFEAIPTGGHPYLLANWKDFETLIQKLILSRSITSIKDLWWDIRPSPDYGTIEIRIADCPPTLKEVEALVAIVHSLAVFIDSEIAAGRKFSPPPEWILRENKWRASRHGISFDLIRDDQGTSLSFKELWPQLRESLTKISQNLGYESHFEFLNELIERGPSSERQRAHLPEGLDGVVRHLIREGLADEPEWA